MPSTPIDAPSIVPYAPHIPPAPIKITTTMMYLETPPRLIETRIFSAMPEKFRRKGVRSDWADANRPGVATDSFIEGPSFDTDGNLYIVDIPFGRIFRIAPDGEWSLAIEYEGW